MIILILIQISECAMINDFEIYDVHCDIAEWKISLFYVAKVTYVE